MSIIIIFIIIWLACGIIAAYIFNQLLKSDFLEYEILDALCFLFGPAALGAAIVIFFNHWRGKKKKYVKHRTYDRKAFLKAYKYYIKSKEKEWEESGFTGELNHPGEPLFEKSIIIKFEKKCNKVN